jgi:hypothetical protein
LGGYRVGEEDVFREEDEDGRGSAAGSRSRSESESEGCSCGSFCESLTMAFSVMNVRRKLKKEKESGTVGKNLKVDDLY